MRELHLDSAAESLPHLAHLIASGEAEEVSPRGLKTHELADVTIEITDPSDCLMYGIGRESYLPAIGVVESLLMIGGVSDPGLLRQVAPVFQRFQDGGALHGAYGPRLRPQIPRVLDRLRTDPDTRQALAMVWDPVYDLAPGPVPRDLPCTVYLAFRIRNGRLTMKTHMRSNDIWRGWCYDVIQFTQLQHTVANMLGLEAGSYVHHADSLHVYHEDLEQLYKVATVTDFYELDTPRPRLSGLRAEGSWQNAQHRALELLYAPERPEPQTGTEQFMLDCLHRALRPKEGS